MSNYQMKKASVRNEAQEWQNSVTESSHSWEEMILTQRYFEKQGKRYGLLREFRENGIC